MAEQNKDYITPVAVGLGAVALGLGVYLFLKKAPSVQPGGKIKAIFKYTNNGQPADYVFQVSFGRIVSGDWFNHVEGLTFNQTFNVSQVGQNTTEMLITLPQFMEAGVYDAEALIRLPGSDWLDYIVKHVTKDAIKVG